MVQEAGLLLLAEDSSRLVALKALEDAGEAAITCPFPTTNLAMDEGEAVPGLLIIADAE